MTKENKLSWRLCIYQMIFPAYVTRSWKSFSSMQVLILIRPIYYSELNINDITIVKPFQTELESNNFIMFTAQYYFYCLTGETLSPLSL